MNLCKDGSVHEVQAEARLQQALQLQAADVLAYMNTAKGDGQEAMQ